MPASNDPERWQRVADLSHEALERDPRERSAFLEFACHGDEELRREVESLIRHEEQADRFLGGSALQALAHAVTSDSPGSLIGRQLGAYEVVAQIGAGGMGEVYRAHDTKLRRDVALKVLPKMFAVHPERLARFTREAHVLATLNHPFIASIYGLEESGGVQALVLELVEGPTLADRIAAGPIPIDETVAIASQIADALEAAHGKAIVHRDLKPSNVKLRADGTVKVLDFGLATAPENEATALGTTPTLTAATHDGVILGTAAYMSPEQARGRPVDKRTDIWAFGCVVYEMLTGHVAFAGDTIMDTIAATLGHEPDWERLPIPTPPGVRRVLARCLEKEPKRRLRDIGDARLELEESLRGTQGQALSTLQPGPAARDVQFQRLTDFVGPKESPSLSPDGKMIAFVARVNGRSQIWIRMLAGGVPLQVTREDVEHRQPRWTPDSSSLIYYVPATPGEEGNIWEVAALGGPPRRLAAAIACGDVSHDGQRIALLRSAGGHVDLLAVARDGSGTERIGVLPAEQSYAPPRWSPDDRWIGFERISSTGFDACLEIVSATGGERQTIARSEWLRGFSWLPDSSGLVYSSAQGSTLLYPPIFNLRRIGRDGRGDCQLTFGDLSYVEPDVHASGKLLTSRIKSQSDIWKFPIDGSPLENTRRGTRITRQTGQAQTPSASPNGTEVVYLSDNGGHGNLWVARTDRSSVRQITFERDPAVALGVPIWSPAGNWIVFVVSRGGRSALWMIHPDGTDRREVVSRGWWACWSGDGRWLYYSTIRDGPCIAKIPSDGGTPILVQGDGAGGPATLGGDSPLYYLAKRKSDSFGLWQSWEICTALPENGASLPVASVLGAQVPVSPLLFTIFLSPDGRWLAAPLTDGATANLWLLPTTSGPMQQVTDFGDRSIVIARSVSWSADSQNLYAAVAETETDIVLLDGLIQ